MIRHDQISPAADGPDTRTNLATWYTPGLSDGLGDRLLMFDNTTSAPLELLRFNRQLSEAPGFEDALRARVQLLAGFDHPSFGPIRTVTRVGDEGELALISHQVLGKRLSDLLHLARGPELAEQLVRLLTPALAELHEQGPGVAHGLLTPARIIVTPGGGLTVIEHVLGSAMQTLALPPRMLQKTFGLTLPAETVGALDWRADVVELGHMTLSLLVGQRVTAADDPNLVANVLDDVERRGESPLYLHLWLERALQLGGAWFTSAREAADALSEWPEQPSLDAEPSQRRLVVLTPAFGRSAKSVDEPLVPLIPLIPLSNDEPGRAPVVPQPGPHPIRDADLDDEFPSEADMAPEPQFAALLRADTGGETTAERERQFPREADIDHEPEAVRNTARDSVRDVAPEPVWEPVIAPLAEPEPAAKLRRPSDQLFIPRMAAPPPPLSGAPRSAADLVSSFEPPEPVARPVELPRAPLAAFEPEVGLPALAARIPEMLREHDAARHAELTRVPAIARDPEWLAKRTEATSVATPSQEVAIPQRLQLTDGTVSVIEPARAWLRKKWVIPGLAASAGALAAIILMVFVMPAPPAQEAGGADTLSTFTQPESPPPFAQAQPPTAGRASQSASVARPPVPRPDTSRHVEPQPQRPAAALAGSTSAATASATRPGLAAAPALGRGELLVTSEPGGATVTIDGTQRGTTPLTVVLSAGDHKVLVSAGTYSTQDSVKIDAGRKHMSTAVLPTTSLFVAAQPWANVWIDGQALGRTPIEDVAILAGPHEILLRHPEFGDRRQSIEAGPGSPVRLLINFRQ